MNEPLAFAQRFFVIFISAAAGGDTMKKHCPPRYETSNPRIAVVSTKGVIAGKAKGSCIVYVYAQNGVCKELKVTVK